MTMQLGLFYAIAAFAIISFASHRMWVHFIIAMIMTAITISLSDLADVRMRQRDLQDKKPTP